MTAIRFALLFSTVASAVSVAQAAPPDVKTVYPAGGQRGTSVAVTITGKNDPHPEVWTSRSGLTVKPGEKANTYTVEIASETPAGVVWLRFHNAEGASSLKPFIVGTLPEVLEKEPNDKESAPQALEAGNTVVNGVLSKSGEVDVFAVPLKAGQTFVASLDANGPLGSPMDGVMQILAPNGAIIEQNDDTHGFDPQIVFTVPADGTYLVRLFAFPATPNSSVRFSGSAEYIYRLTLTTGPVVDHALPMAVTAGTATPLELKGWNLTDELRTLSVAGGETEAVLAHAALANAIPLPVMTHPVLVEVPVAQGGERQELPVPGTITGTVEQPGVVDSYRLPGKKGQKVTFRIAARSFDSPLDPVLRVYAPDGKLVREVDDSTRNIADPELALTLPADGDYRVEVADLHHFGGMRFVYRLTAEPTVADFSLKLAGDALKATAGKPLEIPVTVTRTNGFAGAIEVAVTGLPEGVKVPPVVSEGKGDSAKSVKLVVPADAAAFSGEIQVVGTVKEPALSRTATAPIVGMTEEISAATPETTSVWLTIPPKAK